MIQEKKEQLNRILLDKDSIERLIAYSKEGVLPYKCFSMYIDNLATSDIGSCGKTINLLYDRLFEFSKTVTDEPTKEAAIKERLDFLKPLNDSYIKDGYSTPCQLGGLVSDYVDLINPADGVSFMKQILVIYSESISRLTKFISTYDS